MFFGSENRKQRNELKLRKKDDKLVKKLDALDWGEGRKANKLYKKHLRTIDKIEKNRTWSLPKREHGWYLPNDD